MLEHLDFVEQNIVFFLAFHAVFHVCVEVVGLSKFPVSVVFEVYRNDLFAGNAMFLEV